MANVTMYVEQRSDGRWAVSRPDANRASVLSNTRRAALIRAHEIADGGPVHIQGPNGKWIKEQKPSK